MQNEINSKQFFLGLYYYQWYNNMLYFTSIALNNLWAVEMPTLYYVQRLEIVEFFVARDNRDVCKFVSDYSVVW